MLIFAWAALLNPAPATAHGVHGREAQVYVGSAGPFDVRVRASSTVGDIHVTVFVSESETGRELPDAEVLVSLRDPRRQSVEIGPEPAEPIVPGSNGYVATLRVDVPGDRTLVGRIASSTRPQTGTFEVPIPISAGGGPIEWGTVAILASLVGFALWPLARRVTRRRSGSAP